MNLADYIERHIDAVVEEWAQFASLNIAPAKGLPSGELRDHAKVMLQCMVADMRAAQSGQERHEKARGHKPGNAPELTKTARQHAEQRFREGFSLREMLSEYRALRANVVRRWTKQLKFAGIEAIDDLTRLNESVDQSANEAVAWYVGRVEESRHLMLGVLGHDLRNPLGAVANSAEYLLLGENLTSTQGKSVLRIKACTLRMRRMVNDLLDFTRTRLGAGLPLSPIPAHLGHVCRETIQELEAYHPDRALKMECSGDLRGEWDAPRVAQLVSNLVANAIQHGESDEPVTLSLDGEDHDIVLKVHNRGPVIASEARAKLFEPWMRPVVREAELREGSSGLGLGLYIVREIAVAHGGRVDVESLETEGTTFTVRLPRRPPAPRFAKSPDAV